MDGGLDRADLSSIVGGMDERAEALAADPDRPVPGLVRGGAGRGARGAGCGRARNGRADGSPSVRMVLLRRVERSRPLLLHESGESQGERARGECHGLPCSSTGIRRWSSRFGSRGIVERSRRRVVRLLSDEGSRQPHRRLGLTAVPAACRPSRAGQPGRRGRPTALRRRAEIPLPEHWGGYRVVPDAYEFWQGSRAACTTGPATSATARAGKLAARPLEGYRRYWGRRSEAAWCTCPTRSIGG